MQSGQNHLSHNPKGGPDTQAMSFPAIFMAAKIQKEREISRSPGSWCWTVVQNVFFLDSIKILFKIPIN